MTPSPVSSRSPALSSPSRAAATTRRGVLSPKAVRDFRKDNPLTLTRGSSARKKDPLPSDADPKFKYGRPSEKRLEEEIRRTGPMVPVKSLVEGQFTQDWVKSKQGIDFSKAAAPATIPLPRPTIASESRSRVAHETLRGDAGGTLTMARARALRFRRLQARGRGISHTEWIP